MLSPKMTIHHLEFVMNDAPSLEELDTALDEWVESRQDDPCVRGCEVDLVKYVRGAAHMSFDHLTQGFAADPDPDRRKMEVTGEFCGGLYSVRVHVSIPYTP